MIQACRNRLSRADALGRTAAWAYDETGNRTSVTDGAGTATSYTFDALNRVTEVSAGASSLATLTWHDDSQLDVIARANGVTTTHAYDTAGRLTGIVHGTAGGTVAGFTYTYFANDAMDLRASQTETRPGTSETTTYEYDDAGRLTQWSLSGAVTQTTTLTLSAAGDRLTETITGPSAGSGQATVLSTRSYTYNARHQVQRGHIHPSIQRGQVLT